MSYIVWQVRNEFSPDFGRWRITRQPDGYVDWTVSYATTAAALEAARKLAGERRVAT